MSRKHTTNRHESDLHCMHNRGVEGKLWCLVKELNTNLEVTIQTKYGPTEPVQMGGSLGQGKLLSGPLFDGKMDMIPMEAEEQELGIKIGDQENGEETIGVFLWRDDVILLSDEPEGLQKMLNIADDVAKKNLMEYGEDKSEIMIIGKNDVRPTFTLGEITLRHTDKYKYLGTTLNSKWNLDDHIKVIRGKAEAAYQTILGVAQDRHFKGIKMEVIWKLLEVCIVPIITYGAASWNANKANINELNRIQESIVKRILMTPTSTPNIAIYAGTGLLDMEHHEMKERINNERRINKNDNRLLKRILNDRRSKWTKRNEEIMQELNLDPKVNRSDYQFKRDLNRKTYDHMRKTRIQSAGEQSKFKHLTRDNQDYPFSMKKYMRKLTRLDASIVFKARSRMLEVKENFKTKHKGEIKCRLCKEADETQKHILEECMVLHEDETMKITYEDIYEDEDMDKLKETARKIRQTIDKLEESTKENERTD